jgi:N-methylhydantoinase B
VIGYFNAGMTAGRSAAQVAFKCLTSPLLLPINHGSFRPVDIILPPGRVISATKPAAVRWWMTIPMTVVDTVFKALAHACPERVIAGHHASLGGGGPYAFIDPATGNTFLPGGGAIGLAGGGWGATSDHDGMNATVCLNDGDTHNTPVEASEAKSPMVCIERALVPDSGGPGKFRGGLGVRVNIELLVPGMYQSQIERSQCPPWGLHDGQAGLANRIEIARRDGTLQTFPTAKANPMRLETGDQCITEMGGGGGFWSPLERDPQQVLADARSGYVSVAAAERDYGVVIRQTGAYRRTFEIDDDRTAALRAQLRGLQPATEASQSQARADDAD